MQLIMKWFKSKYPKRINDVWYNQSVHISSQEFPIVFDENDKYIDAKEGLKVAMFRKPNGDLVYYKITSIRCRAGDFSYPSDGIRCDMKRV